ncbi:MAG: endonuclease III domain-containing protein [Candidatus Firestonebacteria bacterium]
MQNPGLMTHTNTSCFLKKIYQTLYSYFGPQYWWPAKDEFEVIVGAILTQNTAWTNVEKAILQLKTKGILSPEKLYGTDIKIVAGLIRSCGYYNIKAARVKNFLDVLFNEFNGRLSSFLALEKQTLRDRLLRIKGIGPETADSIVLYAAKKASFVVDAYTKRFLCRHNLSKSTDSYAQIQSLFENNLPRDVRLFNEYHALFVRLGKDFCRPTPRCNECPLKNTLPE